MNVIDPHIDPNETQVGGEHYKKYPIQPWDLLIDDNIPWAEGCIIEYVIRWRDKGGIQDLEKARHLIDKLIAKNWGEPTKLQTEFVSVQELNEWAARGIYNKHMTDKIKRDPLYPLPYDCERCSEE